MKRVLTLMALGALFLFPALHTQAASDSIAVLQTTADDNLSDSTSGWTATPIALSGAIFTATSATSATIYDGTDATGTAIVTLSVDATSGTVVWTMPGDSYIRCDTGVYVDMPASGGTISVFRRKW